MWEAFLDHFSVFSFSARAAPVDGDGAFRSGSVQWDHGRPVKLGRVKLNDLESNIGGGLV